MNILIQEHPEVNLLPLMNCLGQALGEIQVAIFNTDVEPAKLLAQDRPNIIIFHGDLVNQNVHDLLINAKCALLEHEVGMPRKPSGIESKTFSMVNTSHDNYFPPPCNTFVLNGPQEREKFRSDVSFVGPPSQKAIATLHPLLDIDSDFGLRIYGENRYKNWRYCGIVGESDIQHIYRSSKVIPVFNNALEYDFRVLDCIFAGGVPLCEWNSKLVDRFGSVMTSISFGGPGNFMGSLKSVIENRESILEELKPVRDKIASEHTWYNIAYKLFKMIGLPKTAETIEAKRKLDV
jgi:hypothetical protein